jgi:hypothetical protein
LLVRWSPRTTRLLRVATIAIIGTLLWLFVRDVD